MKAAVTVLLIVTLFSGRALFAQIIIANKNFTFGTTGRLGAGYSPGIVGHTGRQLNLLGQGSLGSRLEQGDYIDLLPAFNFMPVHANKDSTAIQFQARLAFYSTNGTFLGNVNSGSVNGGLTVALPEAFVEARNIMGSKWSAWAGARYMRYDDIHIADYFYFDDHSAEGFGVKYNKTSFTMIFPSAIDTSKNYATPYSYVNIISGGGGIAYRQRVVMIGEQSFNIADRHTLKLLGEYHQLEEAAKNVTPQYKADKGFVIGAKLSSIVKTKMPGSFNQFAVRYGTGIANGGDNGNTQTYNTYGAPDFVTKTYNGAYSLAIVEHALFNFNRHFTTNPYIVFTKSKGGGDSLNKSTDLYGRSIFNRKMDFVIGTRNIFYVTDWFHLLGEIHYAIRKDGQNPDATMWKFILAPTIVPTAERSPWARPHIRLICSFAKYNKFASNNLYSAYLQQSGVKSWGIYFGVRSEWWIF
ncbi:carbohydrate porin [Rhizosphaericola mali]|uniref:Carbohydrate porin n=1 Tax=Rhizosphaericola mali TaxID=2545455 RepID=A0A5P2GCP9_9BACT|nr:carbohydrate porin [Rhizosphaericola mali]QES89361.1 carbohydrate porin [Rhizosphaericola mali]